jgi:hypothetical protein
VVGYSISIVGLNFYKNYKQNPKLFPDYVRQLGVKAGHMVSSGCTRENPFSLLVFLLNGVGIMNSAAGTGANSSPRQGPPRLSLSATSLELPPYPYPHPQTHSHDGASNSNGGSVVGDGEKDYVVTSGLSHLHHQHHHRPVSPRGSRGDDRDVVSGNQGVTSADGTIEIIVNSSNNDSVIGRGSPGRHGGSLSSRQQGHSDRGDQTVLEFEDEEANETTRFLTRSNN